MLKSRIYSGIVGVPIVAALIWLSTPSTAALVAAAAGIGTYEFHRLTMRAGGTVIFLFGAIAATLFVVDATIRTDISGPLLAGTILVPLFVLIFLQPKERLFSDWAWTLAGVLFVAWTLSHAVLLRRQPDGTEWLLTAIILTFVVDSSAYSVGRLIGRRPMAPAISPGKTWEGAAGGFLLVIPAAVLLSYLFGLELHPAEACGLGMLVGVVAQAGDLVESMIKRIAGAKDAGSLIPGHGGLLDRLDSIIPVVVVVYYYLVYGLR